MKRLIYLSVMMVIAQCAVGQDTIVSNKGDIMLANVVEVNRRKTIVTLPGNDELTFQLKNRKIVEIRYKDSTPVVFNPIATKEQRKAYGMKPVIDHAMKRSLGVEFMNPMIGLRYSEQIKNSRFYFTGALNFNLWNGVYAGNSEYYDDTRYAYCHDNTSYYYRGKEDIVQNHRFYRHGRNFTYNRFTTARALDRNVKFEEFFDNSFALANGEKFNPEYHLPANHENQFTKSIFQVDMGFRFQLRPATKRFRPFLSAAIGIGAFEYYKTITQIKFEREIGANFNRPADLYSYDISRNEQSAISFNQHLGFGFEWAFRARWGFSVETVFSTYRFNMNHSTVIMRYKSGEVEAILSKNNVGVFSTIYVPVTLSFNL